MTRRRRFAALACAALLATATLTAGCADDSDRAWAAVRKADAQLVEFDLLGREAADLTTRMDTLGETPDDERERIQLLDAQQGCYRKRLHVLGRARTTLAAILSMNVPDDLRRYADIEVGVVDLQALADGKAIETIELVRQLHDPRASAPKRRGEIVDRLVRLSNEIGAAQKDIAAKRAEAAALRERATPD